MEPQACLFEILSNIAEGTTKEVPDQLRDLAHWLERGGFAPEVHVAKGPGVALVGKVRGTIGTISVNDPESN